MTINHIFLMVSRSQLKALSVFYRATLQPLGYTEMMRASDGTLIGYGSDYPYFWLKAVPEDQPTAPTHIAFDAPNPAAVDEFYTAGLSSGGLENGPPGIRVEMSRQPYYAAFLKDPAGNNIEAVCVEK